MPFIYKYQVDGNGDYVLDGGNKVILESYQYGEGASLDWRHIASSTKKPHYVRSFQVQKFNSGDAWVLIINQKQLVGIYPSQDAALQILNGLFTRVSANDEAAREVMSDQLSKGGSSISAAENDVAYIRLWTGVGPSGQDVTDNPPANTQLYAYAYADLAGTQLITSDVVFLEGQGVLAAFTGTPSPSHFNPADGDELSVTNIGMSGTSAPSISYLWSDGSTAPSLDTTGMEGDAITCTVTASNQWTPDATAFVDFGTVTAVPEDWDTNADGIWATPSATNDPADSQELIASVNYLTTASGGFHGWYRDGTEPASRYWNTLGGDTPPPYTAVWNETDGVWHGWSGHGTLTNIANETIRWDDAGANLWTFAHEGDVLVIVYLSQAPTNFANWRDYDGPLPTDWDTAPNRGYTAAGNTVAPVGTDSTKGVAVEYIVGAGTFDTYAMTSGNSIEASAMRWASAANLSIKMTNTIDTDPFAADYPYLAFWSSAANKWRKGTAQARGNFKTDMIYSMTPADMTWNQSDVPPQAVLFFTADPGDVSTWRPYDGPTGPAILQEAVYSYDATGTEISYTTTGPKEVVYNNAAQTNPPRWIFGPTLQTDHPTLFDQYLNDRYYANTLADALAFVNFYDLVFTCEYNDGTTHTYTVPGTYYNTSVSPSQAFYNNMEIYGQNGIDFALARTPPTNQTSTVTIQVYNVGEAP